jgi:hypothetical protein
MTARLPAGCPRLYRGLMLGMLLLCACSPITGDQQPGPTLAPDATGTVALPPATQPPTAAPPTASPTFTPTGTPPPTETRTSTAVPTASSLKATVNAGLLSCRYGPGPEYLFLYGLREGANIVLVGRTDADNWHWVYVQGRNKCWVNTEFLEIQGDWKALPVVYPGLARLPVSPYYPPTTVLSAVRKGNEVTVEWLDIPLRAGDEEDASMQHYIAEVWRCENGALIFEPLATNELSVTFTDEAGCSSPSHGRVFVQEKHGFAGPADIPWPPFR